MLTFSQIIKYLSKIFLFFIMKYIRSVFSECLLHILVSEKNVHKDLIFCSPKGNTTILLLFNYYFINTYIVYQNRTFIFMKFIFFNFSAITFYNFLSILLYGFIFFSKVNLLRHYFYKIIIIKRFFSFFNIFCYAQQALIFYLLRNFCNVHD